MENLFEKARKDASERLRIGTTKAYARTFMPELIARFQEKYPHVQVHLSEGNSADLLNGLRTRKEDIVVVARTGYDSALRAIPFARAVFALVAQTGSSSCGEEPCIHSSSHRRIHDHQRAGLR